MSEDARQDDGHKLAVALTDNLRFRVAVAANLVMVLHCKHDKPYELLGSIGSTLAGLGTGGLRVCNGCGALELGDGKGWMEPASTMTLRLLMELVK